MITKVTHGWRPGGLVAYLMGPGTAEAHVRPRVIASWDGLDAGWQPEPGPRGEFDYQLGPLIGALHVPATRAGLPVSGKGQSGRGYVWHCSVRLGPKDRTLPDAEWAGIARRLLDGAGIATADDDGGPRWIAVRHADDHIHIAAVLVRARCSQAGPARRPPCAWGQRSGAPRRCRARDRRRLHRACGDNRRSARRGRAWLRPSGSRPVPTRPAGRAGWSRAQGAGWAPDPPEAARGRPGCRVDGRPVHRLGCPRPADRDVAGRAGMPAPGHRRPGGSAPDPRCRRPAAVSFAPAIPSCRADGVAVTKAANPSAWSLRRRPADNPCRRRMRAILSAGSAETAESTSPPTWRDR